MDEVLTNAWVDEVLGQLSATTTSTVLIDYTGPVYIDTSAYIPALQLSAEQDPYADLVEQIRTKVAAQTDYGDWRGILRIRIELVSPRTGWGWGHINLRGVRWSGESKIQ